MELGQGGDAPATIDDVAQFLVDNPDTGTDIEEEGQTADESQADNSDAETNDDAPADEEDDSSEDAKEPTSDVTYKVTVKGEDGADTTVEVDQKELIAGYTRHADYTRKTQELANKEREAFQTVTSEIEKGRSYFMQQAQLAHAAVYQIAGLKSPQEMAQLAHADPAAWVAEQQRQSAVSNVLGQLQQGMQAQQQQTQHQNQQQVQQLASRAWGVLGNEGIDKPKLEGLYKNVAEKYGKFGLTFDRLAANLDPGLVLLMRDAIELQGLKDKKAAVVKKVQDAPKMPAQRQSVPKSEQRNKALESKFSSGRAKLNDLAAWIANN